MIPILKTPREVCKPERQLVTTRQDLINFVNTNKSLKDIYTSLYSINLTVEEYKNIRANEKELDKNGERPQYSKIYDHAIPDKLLFDIDQDSSITPIHDARALEQYYNKLDVLRIITLTGIDDSLEDVGFHIIPFIKLNLKNPRQAMNKYQNSLTDNLSLNIDTKHRGMFGNLAQISRLVDTYNFNKKGYCITLKRGEIDLPLSELREISQEPRNIKIQVLGSKLLDLSYFDNGYVSQSVTHPQISNGFNASLNKTMVEGIDLTKMNCSAVKGSEAIKNIVLGDKFGHRERYHLMCFAKDVLCLDEQETAYWLKLILPANAFSKVKREYPSYRFGQISRIYKTGEMFVSCEGMIEEGFCMGCNK